jgi:Na+/glutamate symporter
MKNPRSKANNIKEKELKEIKEVPEELVRVTVVLVVSAIAFGILGVGFVIWGFLEDSWQGILALPLFVMVLLTAVFASEVVRVIKILNKLYIEKVYGGKV